MEQSGTGGEGICSMLNLHGDTGKQVQRPRVWGTKETRWQAAWSGWEPSHNIPDTVSWSMLQIRALLRANMRHAPANRVGDVEGGGTSLLTSPNTLHREVEYNPHGWFTIVQMQVLKSGVECCML